jgi:hypothetical protein
LVLTQRTVSEAEDTVEMDAKIFLSAILMVAGVLTMEATTKAAAPTTVSLSTEIGPACAFRNP